MTLFIKSVKFYDQDRDNIVKNKITIVVEYGTSPGRFFTGWLRTSREMINELDMLHALILECIIDLHFGKSIKMIKRLKRTTWKQYQCLHRWRNRTTLD